MKRKSVLTATLAFLGFALMLTTALPAHAAGCTDATTAGVYGFSTSDAQNVGYLVFDGHGRWTSLWTNTFDGAVAVTDSGTYEVNPGCGGAAVNDSANLHVNFVIVSGGQEILGIYTDPGTHLTADYKRRDIVAPTK